MEKRKAREMVVADEQESEEEESTDEEPDEQDDEEEQDDSQEESGEEDEAGHSVEAEKKPRAPARKRAQAGRKPLTISLKKNAKVCKVCKATDHQAGFVGAVYMDCPNRPCFLCKQTGHTTMTCPHRVAPEHGVSPSVRRQSGGLVDVVHDRQLKGRQGDVKRLPSVPNRVDAAILRLHSRRVTAVEFHPSKDNLVISGDKKGQVAVWDFEKVFEKTVHNDVHRALVNSIKFHTSQPDVVYSASSDGLVCCTDLETGIADTLINLNPDGWQGPETWRMMYGMDVHSGQSLVLAADDRGLLYMYDVRVKNRLGAPRQVHKKGSKVVSLQCNPCEPDLFMTASNDWTANIWDLRQMQADCTPLALLQHPRVVNSAFFSPVTGSKILTTCQDNRLRVWDYLHGDLSSPDREIVHSNDFNRYLTPFKAEWDPRDISESLIVVGRYISDVYEGLALHPIDFIDASTGQLVSEVWDPNITTISPVNKVHPRIDAMVTGSSRSLYLWRPKDDEDSEEGRRVGVDDQVKIRLFNVEPDEKKGKKGAANGKGKRKWGDDDSD